MNIGLRQKQANAIERSAHRLASFCKLDVPEFIIESERQVLTRALIRLPVDSTAQAAVTALEAEGYQAEQKHLWATGFYTELDHVPAA